jgi:predicted nucleic acid-binding protein
VRFGDTSALVPLFVAESQSRAAATWERWSEVTAVDLVRRRAERIVETHPLRAADALQIGAAVVAAEREGFHVIGPD